MDQTLAFSLCLLFCSQPSFSRSEEWKTRRSDDVSALQIVVGNLSRQVANNKAQIAAAKADCHSKVTAMEASNNAKIASLEAELAKARTSIAFHAYFNSHNVTLGPSSPIILDRVLSNVGHGYDAHTGNFRAPVSGTYMFVVNFMGDYHTSTYLYIMVDDVARDYSVSHGDGSTWDHASASLVVHLKVGQRVWLRSDVRATKTYRGSHWTAFSGFLINVDP